MTTEKYAPWCIIFLLVVLLSILTLKCSHGCVSFLDGDGTSLSDGVGNTTYRMAYSEEEIGDCDYRISEYIIQFDTKRSVSGGQTQ